MERPPYAPLQPSHEGPNPLRPYYRPPSIGLPTDPQPSTNRASPSSNTSSYFPDISYRDIMGDSSTGGPSATNSIRSLADQMLWKYSSVFLAQPFEVAKMVLQVRFAGKAGRLLDERRRGEKSRSRAGKRRSADEGYTKRQPSTAAVHSDSEEEDDEMSYFTSTVPETRQYDSRAESPARRSGSSRGSDSRSRRRRSGGPQEEPQYLSHKLELRRPDSLTEVISQLWTREGAWGIWKGTNVTFLHNLLLRTIETWMRGMLCAVVNLPDPSPGTVGVGGVVGGLDILDSPSPMASLGVTVAAAGLAGLVLVPLDVARTRVMLTSTTQPPRSILPLLRTLPNWICPPSLALPSLLHATLPTFISTSTPLFLRANLHVDPIISPAYYNVATFLSSTLELFAKLPVETVLRRAQMDYITTSSQATTPRRHQHPADREPEDDPFLPHFDTVVDIGPYTGTFSTMWKIAREEGTAYQRTAAMTKGAPATSAHQPVFRQQKGQGVQGLWRGWKVGLWALVGVWGTAGLGSLGGRGGSEF